MRILVVRNDKLGDFMLAWPAFAILKHYWPDASVCALVPLYTADLANLCPWIDEVLIDHDERIFPLGRKLATHRFDALLTLYSTNRVAWAGWLARIPYRLSPATKVFQFLYNKRLEQRRSRSEKPEYAYNNDIIYRFLHDNGIEATEATAPGDFLPATIKRPLLTFSVSEAEKTREQLSKQHGISSGTRLVFIHPGNGGSANNLTPEQYIELANGLQSPIPLTFVITAGPGEELCAGRIADGIMAYPAILLQPDGGLIQLAQYIQLADLFISCSTGPLHIAGALDRPTAAFYPRHRSGSPLRWQSLNASHKRLIFTPPSNADAKDVSAIDIADAIEKINLHLLTW